VVGVVQTDIDHLPRSRDGSADPEPLQVDLTTARPEGLLEPSQATALEEVPVVVPDDGGYVPDPAIREQDGRPLFPDLAHPQQLHVSFSFPARCPAPL